MTRPLLILALVSAFAWPADATIVNFETPLGLTGSQEMPLNASPATGFGSATYDTSTLLLDVNLNWADLLVPATAAHIHLGAGPGTNGPVAISFTAVGFPNTTSGTFSHTFDLGLASSYSASFITNSGGTVAAARAALLAGLDAGYGYFNIHTAIFPGGEIRGDISPVVPEPATLALVGMGAVAALIRRRFA